MWDRANREIIAEFDFGRLKDDTPYPYVVQCEQHKLGAIALERLRALPNATVEFSARVTGFDQDDETYPSRWKPRTGRGGSWPPA